jgi:2-keto-4-pentenoate hydratase/2-oxohepta-3-ene-1,7-dioic acid hydratase in catechol pathway
MNDTYQHTNNDGKEIELPAGKVVCIGRNYMAHINELNNEVPEQSLYFMKPVDALVAMQLPIKWPLGYGSCHHELEIAVLISQKLKMATLEEASKAIWGYGLALDLTLRDLQTRLKQKGQPWERAKAFDGSCPVSAFVPFNHFDGGDIAFSLSVNGRMQQQGNTANMMLKIPDLIADVSQLFTLNPGDIVLTGTPEGVAALKGGDELVMRLDEQLSVNTSVASVG